MVNRSHITVVEGESTEGEEHPTIDSAEAAQDTVASWEDDAWQDEPPVTPDRSVLVPGLALVVIIGWSALFAYANWSVLRGGMTLQGAVELIVDWVSPVLLVLLTWLLLSRNSKKEAQRYGVIARSLSDESALMEKRLVTVNRELSLAREFLASQARDLEYLGRSAADRLSEHADRLQALVLDNGQQVEALAGTSLAALENLEKLRGNLPVIANSAKDVSNQIGNAGRTAQDQLGAMISGFERLNDFGEASERQVLSLQTRVNDALAAFQRQADDLQSLVAERFAALASGSDAVREDLQVYEIEALAALQARSLALRNELAETHGEAAEQEEQAVATLRARIETLRDDAGAVAQALRDEQNSATTALGNQIDSLRDRLVSTIAEIQQVDASAMDAANAKLQALLAEAEGIDARITERHRLFEEDMNRRSASLSLAQDEAAAALDERMGHLDEAILARRAAQREQLEAMARDGDKLGDRIAALADVFSTVAAHGHEARESLSGGIEALTSNLMTSRETLQGTDEEIARLTDASVRLLELIQASAKQTGTTLPDAMQASEARLAELEARTREITDTLGQTHTLGASLLASLEEAEARTNAAMTGIDGFYRTLQTDGASQLQQVEQLREGLAALAQDNANLSHSVQKELAQALDTLDERSRAALESIERDQAHGIARLAEHIGTASAEQIDRALADKTGDALAQLDEARSRSADAAQEITQHLRDQLARLNDLTANLESRIAHARDKASDTIDGDFSRRVALITESLNSNSIDIAKALSSDVTDTAWASYLRGDRGIFTRRAVRLLSNAEAREIAELYDADNDFREHVNRYIHDFEAMLRMLLSTRDGNAVSVTLLSSDMGKLYVALAQALERLRQ